MTVTKLLTPLKLSSKAKALIAAPALTLTTAEDAVAVNTRIVDRKALLKDLQAKIDAIKKPLNEARNALLEQERAVIKPLEAAIRRDVEALLTWRDTERRKALEAHAAQAIAAQAAAEAQKASTTQQVLDAAATVTDPVAKAALTTYAATVGSLPVVAAVPALAETKLEGLAETTTGRWVGEVTNLREFLMAVLEGTIPLSCVVPAQAEIDRHATSLRELLNWPGVTVRPPRKTLAAR